MKDNLHVGNLGPAAMANDRVKLVEPPGAVEAFQILVRREPARAPDARPKPEAITSVAPEERPRSIAWEVAQDLHSHCPVCGNPYQPRESVLALDCVSFAASAVPASPAAPGSDRSSKVILGHRGCVLPRLLTLVASFGPAVRFANAMNDFSAGESLSPERRHDEP
jgi:hypothetical protein